MRTIVREDEELQVQADDAGTHYHYRKDYLYKGDMKEEYTLVLLWSKKGVMDGSGHSGETVCPCARSELPLSGQQENP
jgi:hypothetical protein